MARGEREGREERAGERVEGPPRYGPPLGGLPVVQSGASHRRRFSAALVVRFGQARAGNRVADVAGSVRERVARGNDTEKASRLRGSQGNADDLLPDKSAIRCELAGSRGGVRRSESRLTRRGK